MIMCSQSTSSGMRDSVPSNRDPRYFRPAFAYLDTSNDSIQLDMNNPVITIMPKNKCNIIVDYLVSSGYCGFRR